MCWRALVDSQKVIVDDFNLWKDKKKGGKDKGNGSSNQILEITTAYFKYFPSDKTNCECKSLNKFSIAITKKLSKLLKTLLASCLFVVLALLYKQLCFI